MADDELTENAEGPRRRTYTPPGDDAVFTGSFPVIDDAEPDAVPLEPVAPSVPTPSAAIAPPVRTSLTDAEILATFSAEGAGSTAEMMNELERQVTLREDEEEAFTMWANLTRATRGLDANDIIQRERIIFDGGVPEPVVEAPSIDVPVATDHSEVAPDEPVEPGVSDDISDEGEEALSSEGSEPAQSDSDPAAAVDAQVRPPESGPVEAVVEADVLEDHWPLEQSDTEVVSEETAQSAEASRPPLAPLIDRIGLEPTPENNKTLTRVGLFWTWWATLTPVVGVVAGAFFIQRGLGVLETLAAVGAGALLSGVIIAAAAYAGARTGLSTAHTSQITFGRAGAIAPSIFLVIIRVALLGVLVLAAESLITRLVVLTNWWPFELWLLRAVGAVLVASIVVTLGLLGGRVLRLALYVSAGMSAVAIGGFIALTAPAIGVWAIDPWSASASSVVALGSLALVGFLVLFGHTGGDLARYSAGSATGSVSAVSGLAAVVPSVVFVGYVAWVASATPVLGSALVDDPVGALAGELPAWFPAPVLLGLVLPLIVLSALALFSGGLAVLSAGVPASRQGGTLVVGALALGSAGAALVLDLQVSQYFPDVVFLVGVVVVAWGGAYATDIALGRQRLGQLSSGEVPLIRVAPLAGFALAVGLGWGLISSGVGWLSWLGYVFPLLSMAGLGDVSGAQPGVLVALVVASLVSAIAALSSRSDGAKVGNG